MSLLAKHEGDVRRRLLHPSEPQQETILSYLLDVIDELVTEANQTGEPWYVAHAHLTVSPGVSDYPLDSIAFGLGKIRYAWTLDEGDPLASRRPVDIVSYEDLTGYYGGGDPAPASHPSNFPHSARAFATYYDSKSLRNMLSVGPVPSRQAEYRLVYEPLTVRGASPQDQGFRFDNFDWYVADLAALKCLPAAKWRGLTRTEMREQRKEIRETLAVGIDRGDDLFRRFKFASRDRSEERTIGFGESRWGY